MFNQLSDQLWPIITLMKFGGLPMPRMSIAATLAYWVFYTVVNEFYENFR